MKSDLEQKRDLLTSMESDLAKAVHCNGQISGSFHRCDVDLSKYSDLLGQMSDRWRRIQTQIDSRYSSVVCTHISSTLQMFFSISSVCHCWQQDENILSSILLRPTLSSSECGTWRSRRNS